MQLIGPCHVLINKFLYIPFYITDLLPFSTTTLIDKYIPINIFILINHRINEQLWMDLNA